MIGIPETGTLSKARIAATLAGGYRLSTADGGPARLAIINDQGAVIEQGDALARAAWELCLRVQTNFWDGFGFRVERVALARVTLEATDAIGFRAAGDDGHPVRLAVIDNQGAVLEQGEAVAREAWNLCVAVRKKAWIDQGRLVVHSAPPGLANQPAAPAEQAARRRVRG